MVFQVIEENGQKKIQPLTSDARVGNPLGTIIAVYSNHIPDGYLPCNGVAFDQTQYPALYALLGDNHTPDLRECVLVGIGQSDNDYDVSTNPTGIQDHDVYTLGQFKDDQLQGHTHNQIYLLPNYAMRDAPSYQGGSGYGWTYPSSATTENTGRKGTTTHGKQIGVNYVIKAVPGIEESQADYVADVIKDYVDAGESYSTTEVKTNKTWIDGKPIYRRVFTNLSVTATDNNWHNLFANDDNIQTITNFNCNGTDNTTYDVNVASQFLFRIYNNYVQYMRTVAYSAGFNLVMFEYTKTTD